MHKILTFAIAFFLVISISCLNSFGQSGKFQVDNFNGTASLSYPLHVVKSGSVEVPVNLVYVGSGIKVKDVEGNAGMGWHLVAGGEIRREVLGLPDDAKADFYSNPRLGWIHNPNRTKVAGFNILNDNNTSTCTDEQTDLSYLQTNFADLSDTEPDIFNINAPGLNCQLIFDENNNIKVIPFQDLKITYRLYSDINPGRIIDFTITNDKGVTYSFGDSEVTTKWTTTSLTENDIKYFKREYDQYKHRISYVSAWKLKAITDYNGNSIWFSYTTALTRNAENRINLAIGESSTLSTPFTVQTSSEQKVLDRIYYTGRSGDPIGEPMNTRSLKFKYISAVISPSPLISGIEGKGLKTTFIYDTFKTKEPGSVKTKNFLKYFLSNSLKMADFEYYGVSGDVVDLPDSLSKEIDQWGYYNGSNATTLLPTVYINPNNSSLERYRTNPAGTNSTAYAYTITGADRATNPLKIANGSLKSIKSYYGGSTSIVYEPKDYYDVNSGSTILGGGLRVKQVIDQDQTNPGNNSVTNYSYLNPASGKSSGKVLALPLYTFSRPFTGSGATIDLWKNSTVRLEESVARQDHSVVYTWVTESRSGAGRTVFEYSAPGGFDESSALPDWTPTITHIGRPGCVASGFMSSQKNAYPFAPNMNYDFERGLLKKTSLYNEANQKVRESLFNYTRSAPATVISGLSYDYIEGLVAYAKYKRLAQTTNLLTKIETIDYDAPSLTQFSSTVVNNLYESPNHRLLSTQSTTKSDGSILKTQYKYAKDYVASNSANSSVQAIYLLQQQNANIPIETYTQVERSGISKTISATIIKSRPLVYFGMVNTVPDQKLNFLNTEGITNFQVSTISGNNFVQDSRYLPVENYLLYDVNGNLVSMDKNDKKVKSVIVDYNLNEPVATFQNARMDEVIFTDFDTEASKEFGYPVPAILDSLGSRSGKYAYKTVVGNQLIKAVTKNPVADYYVFSLWVKSAAAGTVNVSLVNASNVTLDYSLPYANTANEWKYYRLKVPVASMSSTFTVKIGTSTSITIDDILFYPDHADVLTTSYDLKSFVKTIETNGNGIAKYYTYNTYRRLKQVLDQDKNIVLNRSYANDLDANSFVAYISSDSNLDLNVPENFSASSGYSDGDGMSYSWNFGDGTVHNSMSASVFQHTYHQVGTYTITLTITSPIYGSKTTTKTVTVSGTSGYAKIKYRTNSGSITQLRTASSSFTTQQLGSGDAQIQRDVSEIKLTTTGAFHPSTKPNGFKNIQIKMLDATGQVLNILCVPSNLNTYTIPVNLQGVTTLEIVLLVDPCEGIS